MRKLICIVGPTGVGKTDLALKIAKKYNGTLISADSIQVFKGLDIISGKDKPEDISLTPLLIDILPPSQAYSAFEFSHEANKKISEVFEKQKLPIIVGGTGLYIKALIEGLDEKVQPDTKLRSKLAKLNVQDLSEKLKNLDRKKFESLNNSDAYNPRRLIRAIEVSRSKKKELSIKQKKTYEAITIGLFAPTDVLKKRIDKRVEKRLAQGALQEAKELFSDYAVLTPQVKNANGYKQLFAFLHKEISFDDAIFRWKVAEYRHAKNQMTWFRKYGNVTWFNICAKNFTSEIELFIRSSRKPLP